MKCTLLCHNLLLKIIWLSSMPCNTFELISIVIRRFIKNIFHPDAYSVPNVTILFAPWSGPGATSWCVQININDDNRVENSEHFVLQLVSNNPLVEVDGNYSTTIVIIAEDSACKSDNEISIAIINSLNMKSCCHTNHSV